jgi:hypothetical protein
MIVGNQGSNHNVHILLFRILLALCNRYGD